MTENEGVAADPIVAFLRARLDEDEVVARAAADFDYARCGSWEARGPYPADGEADGVSRPRGNLRSEIGRDDIFLEAELPWDLIPHMARHDPARVLREIEAKRRLLALYDEHERMDRETFEAEGQHARSLSSLRAAYFDAVRVHAAVYADHPEFREEWRP